MTKKKKQRENQLGENAPMDHIVSPKEEEIDSKRRIAYIQAISVLELSRRYDKN